MVNCNQRYDDFIKDTDKQYLLFQIFMHGHNLTNLAKKTGLTRTTLRKKLETSQLNIKEVGTIHE